MQRCVKGFQMSRLDWGMIVRYEVSIRVEVVLETLRVASKADLFFRWVVGTEEEQGRAGQSKEREGQNRAAHFHAADCRATNNDHHHPFSFPLHAFPVTLSFPPSITWHSLLQLLPLPYGNYGRLSIRKVQRRTLSQSTKIDVVEHSTSKTHTANVETINEIQIMAVKKIVVGDQ